MLFNSYIFIFLFLPITLVGYYVLNHFGKYRIAKFFLSGMSLWFYAYFNLSYFWIILSSILLNYGISFLIKKLSEKEDGTRMITPGIRRFGIGAGILVNLGLFFYFKYFDFFLENVNLVFRTDFALRHILLPLGISFFTFQQLSFVIDRAKGKAEHYPFPDYLTFVTFFPQLIAGPIVLYEEMMPQFARPENARLNFENLSRGTILFTLGLAKKVLLADVLARIANYGFSNAVFLDTTSTVLMLLAYCFQIYFDFSGYSDMAIGLGKMFNIELPVNFDSPYKACSVKEFWQHWHMTLSRFFVRYVYIPLGGSRKGRARTLWNIFLVFFLSGIWHGANWTYIIWGAMQGILVVWDNLGLVGVVGSNDKIKAKVHIPRPVGWFLTFGFFNLSLLFFRSDSVKTALQLYKDLFSFTNTGHLMKMTADFRIPELYPLTKLIDLRAPALTPYIGIVLLVILLIVSFVLVRGRNARQIALNVSLSEKTAFFIALILVWCIISFEQVSTFIYFNF